MSVNRFAHPAGKLIVVLLAAFSCLGSVYPGSSTEKSRLAKAAAPSVQLQRLYRTGSVTFAAPPPTALETRVKCDQKGNIYAFYSESLQAVSAAPLRKISPDDQAIVKYARPHTSGYQHEVRIDYDVTPKGRVYYLLAADKRWPPPPHQRSDYLIASFNDDGTVDSVVKLEAASDGYLQAERFSAFPAGEVLPGGGYLVSGFLLHLALKQAKVFTGIYDGTGELVRELTARGDVTLHPQSGGPPEGSASENGAFLAVAMGGAVSAPDGNVYLLRGWQAPRLIEVSPDGNVTRVVKVKPPLPGLRPTEVSLAQGGDVLIVFGPIPMPGEQTGNPKSALETVDPKTGRVAAAYAPPGGLSSACISPQGEFEFLGMSKEGKLEVTKYASR